jgi:hypothetical protein
MEMLGFVLLVCLASFSCVWLANQLVGLLSGEHPRDTGRLWVDTLFGVQGLPSGSWARRVLLIMGVASLIWAVIRSFWG